VPVISTLRSGTVTCAFATVNRPPKLRVLVATLTGLGRRFLVVVLTIVVVVGVVVVVVGVVVVGVVVVPVVVVPVVLVCVGVVVVGVVVVLVVVTTTALGAAQPEEASAPAGAQAADTAKSRATDPTPVPRRSFIAGD
jgi:fatty acid desaturase